MATGRSTLKHSRIYANGYDLSGSARSFGPLPWEYEELDATCPLGDEAKGYLPGQPNITMGALNVVLNAGNAAHDTFSGLSGTSYPLMIPIGIRAAPAAGDPVWCGRWYQLGYQAAGEGVIAVNLPFGMWDAANLIAYHKPWGVLLAPLAARTAVNSSTGIDDRGAATTAGGYMIYQVTAGNGTATIKVQDAATNLDGSFSDLSGATSGSIDCSTPKSGIVAIGTTATVRQFLRWQIVLGTATTLTFAQAFVRI